MCIARCSYRETYWVVLGGPGTPLGRARGGQIRPSECIIWPFARISAGSPNYSIGARERYLAMADHIVAVAPDGYTYFGTNMGIGTTYRLCVLCISRRTKMTTRGGRKHVETIMRSDLQETPVRCALVWTRPIWYRAHGLNFMAGCGILLHAYLSVSWEVTRGLACLGSWGSLWSIGGIQPSTVLHDICTCIGDDLCTWARSMVRSDRTRSPCAQLRWNVINLPP